MDAKHRRWLLLSGTLVVVFLWASSMQVGRLFGWHYLILFFLAGTLSGLGFLWAKKQFLPLRSQLSKPRRAILVATVVALALAAMFINNHNRPDEGFNDALACFGLLAALLFWGLYRILSRFLDALHARFSRR